MVLGSRLSYIWLPPNSTLKGRRVPVSLRIIIMTSIAGWEGGKEKSTGSKGEVVSTMPVILVVLQFKVVDEKVAVEIVQKWRCSIVGSGACVL